MEYSHLKPKLKLVLESEGREVLDEETAGLLYLIDRHGSIIKASRYLGIPYSKAWTKISNSERHLRIKLVAPRKGGARRGGTELTEDGKLVLQRYLAYYKELIGSEFHPLREEPSVQEHKRAVFVGSHDLIVSNLIGSLRDKGVEIDAYWLGSVGGLNAILYGEADIAGTHLLDEDYGEYNIPYYRSLNLSSVSVLVRGYERAIGFVSKTRMSLEEILEGLLGGRLRLINRQAGSGSRRLLDHLLAKKAAEKGLKPFEYPRLVRGYEKTANTHFKIAEAVSRGDADVGIGIQSVAVAYGLEFTPVSYERYDFIVHRDYLEGDGRVFLRVLKEEVPEYVKKLPGYRVDDHLGEIIEE